MTNPLIPLLEPDMADKAYPQNPGSVLAANSMADSFKTVYEGIRKGEITQFAAAWIHEGEARFAVFHCSDIEQLRAAVNELQAQLK